MSDYDRYLLVLDEAEGPLGRHALQLVQLGVDVVYAQDADEAHLLAREESQRIGAALFRCPADPEQAQRLARRLVTAIRSTPEAVAPVGERPPAAVCDALRGQGLRWALFEPFAERELRFVATAVLLAGNPEDRRKGHRFPTSLPATVKKGFMEKEARVHDLSRFGAYLAVPKPFPVESNLELDLDLGEWRLRTRAVVVNAGTGKTVPREDVPEGMGVQFAALDETKRTALEGYLDELAQRFRL